MNVERLHAIVLAVREDLEQTNEEAILNQLANELNNQISQPNQPQHQQQVSDSLQTLNDNLSKAPSNEFSPAWRQALKELGMDDLLGENLLAKVKEVFERNQITLAIAQKEIQTLHDEVHNLRTALDQLITGFQHFELGAEELELGQCELGVLIPREPIHNKLEEFGEELIEIDKIFSPFAELVTGSRPGFELRTISSSEFNINFLLSPEMIVSIAIALERLVAAYKKILEIRIYHNKMQDLGLTKKALSGVEDHVKKIMTKAIDSLVNELLKKNKTIKDDGRRNELKNELIFAMKKIANRIDKGYNFEIREELLSEEEKDGELSKEKLEQINTIKSANKTLQFMKLEGEPILCLPEFENDINNESQKKNKTSTENKNEETN